MAMPLLPLQGEGSSLVYGSADAGTSVFNSDARASALMQQAAEDMHLAPHHVANQRGAPPVLCSAGDVEGHIGADGR